MKISLRIKTIILVIIVAILIATVSILISYNTYAKTIDGYYKTTLTNLAETAASMMDSDKIEEYYQTLKKDEEYEKYLNILFEIKENNDIEYLYIEKIVGNNAVAIMDADRSDTAMKLGDTFDISEGADVTSLSEGIPAFISNEPEVGWVCSIFSPIKDSSGKVVALVGADMSMDDVMHERRIFLMTVCVAILVTTILAVAILLVIIQKIVVKPINLLSVATSNFVSDKENENNDGKVSLISSLQIHSGDELQTLSEAIKTMEADINEYINNLTEVTIERERMGAELNVATQIQADMLPRIFPAFPERTEFDIFATMLPAKEVGGDFYDFFLVDEDHIAIVIADVSGKGVPAALFMVIAKTLIKNHAQGGLSPAAIFTSTNEQLCEGNEAGLFVTAWMGIIEISTGNMTYVNAGHNPPCIKTQGEGFQYLKSRPGFVLAGMEGIKYKEFTMQLSKGDMLYLYTDGVSESTNSNNELYGEDRLHELLNQCLDLSSEELLYKVKESLDEFVQEAPQFDDITMLAFCYQGNGKGDVSTKRFPAKLEELSRVSDFVEEILRNCNASEKAINQVNIIVDELASNVLRYSGSDYLEMSCSVNEKTILLQFKDSGMEYNPLNGPEVDITLSADERQIGGLGVLMVKQMAKSIEYSYENQCNILTVQYTWE